MSTMDDREKGFERKFAHDAEMQFKAEARRNKKLGLWAAGKMGIMSPQDAMAYAQEVITADFEEAGDEDVYRKVSGDLDAKGAEWTEAELREKMTTFLTEAKAELMDETN
ncbi:MAG: DUF1476 domain-containing protein [Pseudomonadota bacterium]